MSIQKPPAGTRGVRTPPSIMARIMTPLMVRVHRRSGDRFAGMDLLYLAAVFHDTGLVAPFVLGLCRRVDARRRDESASLSNGRPTRTSTAP